MDSERKDLFEGITQMAVAAGGSGNLLAMVAADPAFSAPAPKLERQAADARRGLKSTA